MALVLDTGPLIAALHLGDPRHEPCAELLTGCGERLVIPAPILPEVDYVLLRERAQGAMSILLGDIAHGAYAVEDLVPADYERVLEVRERYADAKVGFVDAAVLAVVERLGETKLATLDRRHFSIMRPRHVEALKLLPA